MSLYNLFNTISAIMVLLFNLLHYRQQKKILGGVSRSITRFFASKPQNFIYKILSADVLWVILEILIITAVQYICTGFLNGVFGEIVNTGANYFGRIFVAPLLVVALCILLKIDPLAQLDLITPAYPLGLVFVKIACHFGCCCTGFVWEKGIYNPVTRQIEFPSQFLEADVALLLFVFLVCFKKKFKKGTVFPIYLITYSALRFFTEFTRGEPAVFLGLKTYQIICIVAVLVGIGELIAARAYDKYCQRKQKQTA